MDIWYDDSLGKIVMDTLQFKLRSLWCPSAYLVIIETTQNGKLRNCLNKALVGAE